MAIFALPAYYELCIKDNTSCFSALLLLFGSGILR